MRFLTLSRGKRATVDDEDYPLVCEKKWSLSVGGYAVRREGGKIIYLHRFLMRPDNGKEVDHRNGVRTDCRRSNLRICTKSQNRKNNRKKRNSRVPFKGIEKTLGGRWVARICSERKRASTSALIQQRVWRTKPTRKPL